MTKRFGFGIVLAFMVLLINGFWLAFSSVRPPMTLD